MRPPTRRPVRAGSAIAWRLAALLVVFMAPRLLQAQICVGDTVLTTQAQVDSFNCGEVTGSLRISGSDIVNVNALSSLTSVGQRLSISKNPC